MSEFIVVVTFTNLDNIIAHKISYSKQFEDQLEDNAERHRKNLEKDGKYAIQARYYQVINGLHGFLHCKKELDIENGISYGSLEQIELCILEYKNFEKQGFRRVGRINCIDCHKNFVKETEFKAGFNRCLRCFQKYEQRNKNAYAGTIEEIGSQRPFYVKGRNHLKYEKGKFKYSCRDVEKDVEITADFEVVFDEMEDEEVEEDNDDENEEIEENEEKNVVDENEDDENLEEDEDDEDNDEDKNEDDENLEDDEDEEDDEEWKEESEDRSSYCSDSEEDNDIIDDGDNLENNVDIQETDDIFDYKYAPNISKKRKRFLTEIADFNAPPSKKTLEYKY
jgi:hypothetical protein